MNKLESSAIVLSVVLGASMIALIDRSSKDSHKDFMNLSKQLSDLDTKQDKKLNELRVLILQDQLSRPKADTGGVANSADAGDARAKDERLAHTLCLAVELRYAAAGRRERRRRYGANDSTVVVVASAHGAYPSADSCIDRSEPQRRFGSERTRRVSIGHVGSRKRDD